MTGYRNIEKPPDIGQGVVQKYVQNQVRQIPRGGRHASELNINDVIEKVKGRFPEIKIRSRSEKYFLAHNPLRVDNKPSLTVYRAYDGNWLVKDMAEEKTWTLASFLNQKQARESKERRIPRHQIQPVTPYPTGVEFKNIKHKPSTRLQKTKLTYPANIGIYDDDNGDTLIYLRPVDNIEAPPNVRIRKNKIGYSHDTKGYPSVWVSPYNNLQEITRVVLVEGPLNAATFWGSLTTRKRKTTLVLGLNGYNKHLEYIGYHLRLLAQKLKLASIDIVIDNDSRIAALSKLQIQLSPILLKIHQYPYELVYKWKLANREGTIFPRTNWDMWDYVVTFSTLQSTPPFVKSSKARPFRVTLSSFISTLLSPTKNTKLLPKEFFGPFLHFNWTLPGLFKQDTRHRGMVETFTTIARIAHEGNVRLTKHGELVIQEPAITWELNSPLSRQKIIDNLNRLVKLGLIRRLATPYGAPRAVALNLSKLSSLTEDTFYFTGKRNVKNMLKYTYGLINYLIRKRGWSVGEVKRYLGISNYLMVKNALKEYERDNDEKDDDGGTFETYSGVRISLERAKKIIETHLNGWNSLVDMAISGVRWALKTMEGWLRWRERKKMTKLLHVTLT